MDIPQQIAEARSLNVLTASIADYRRLFDRIASGHIFATITPRDGLWYRVRKNLNRELFASTKDLWYPPAALVRLGRANEPGKPVLYLSEDGAVALRETRFSSGDWLTVLTCKINPSATLKLQEIGILEHVNKGNLPAVGAEINRFIQHAHRRGYGNQEYHSLVRSYFVEEFTREVNLGDEHTYKPSAAIASLLMSRLDCDGIAYPAIKSAKLDTNIALKSAAADRKLDIVAVDVVEARRLPNGEIAVAWLATSSDFTNSGSISYRAALGETTSLPWVNPRQRQPL